ncbi:uncharacterized protein LOC128888151 [Hylaeus anthracinus]|uniref:uncharacterized protein LOC128888151 n=1 Tax=Hylaeus anthracinus TaxID=313031 RepID=UPI0023B8E4ED|nr:uncharacterized protein LOC128888151 [Hylaeus anthracinus]XP_054000762.1 uncharacterized protein LOC128888151 [Hylaeus anthracinus]XP_054000763.1 uncharacterized protein LOC128888151 [Hylaeus anthracinus]
MSKRENKLFYNVEGKVQEKKKYTKLDDIQMACDNKMEEFVRESQNFCLRLSQDSLTSDTNNEKDVIVISDSSSTCSSPRRSPEFKLNRRFIKNKQVCIVDSSDSSDAQEERPFQAWHKNKETFLDWNNRNVNKNSALFTSDDTSSNSSEQSKRYIPCSVTSDNNSFCFTPENNIDIISKTNTQFHSCTTNQQNLLSNSTGGTSKYKSFKTINLAGKVLHDTNKKNNDFEKKLTPKNTLDIMKNIKSTRVVYKSRKRENNTVIDESIDNGIHPAISPKDNLETMNTIIDESIANSESDIIQGSQINSTNFYRNHVSRFLDTPYINTHKDRGTMYTELSERKKKQISKWLMTNSSDSKSDNSFDIVPATNKDDISSGNSSLERLEMNYETPNNRGKIYSTIASEKIINQDCNKIVTPTVQRQITLYECTPRSKINVPRKIVSKDNCADNMSSNSTIHTPQSVNVMECADILDKLYGKSWREKADVLFPKSEPRKQIITTRNRAVQTERRRTNKGKIYAMDSDNDNSDTSLKDLRVQKSSTKKTARKNTKQRDSFINDETSSESGNESLYYTALTNPRVSTASVKLKRTVPSIVQRAIAICDTDTENEDDNSTGNDIRDVRRKKLLFNDDESENSSTSEFDPGDQVSPKPTARKDPIKIPRQISKTNNAVKPSDNQKYEKHNTFLASLSENVPLTNAHPDAKKYRINYKNNKENLSNHLYKLYNEKIFDKRLPENMLIEWNVRMRGSAGFCYNKKSAKKLGGIVKSSRIVLATKVLDTPDRLRDTLIHEMCHAAAWLINDVSDGHGPFWTGWANKAMKTFPELPPIRRCHDYKINTKFTYRCISCGYSIGRHSKSLDTERKRCGHCYGKFELLINKTTKSGTVQVQTPKREVAGFALYVKENYNVVKKEHNVRHAEVMKILGQQFSSIKIANKERNVENDPDILG